MHKITEWLKRLGMSEYAQRSADNGIDFTILGDLTDRNLKDLGVASLGHRQLVCYAALHAERGAAPAVPPLAEAGGIEDGAIPTATARGRARHCQRAF